MQQFAPVAYTRVGDGFAEVAGRAAGPTAAKLPHNPDKVWPAVLLFWTQHTRVHCTLVNQPVPHPELDVLAPDDHVL